MTDSKRQHNASKYDFVKVRVWLSEEHYYVLSRFLVSRMLTATLIKRNHAIRIALELKKRLVDRNLLDLTQANMEAVLFSILETYGYGETNRHLYKMMSM